MKNRIDYFLYLIKCCLVSRIPISIIQFGTIFIYQVMGATFIIQGKNKTNFSILVRKDKLCFTPYTSIPKQRGTEHRLIEEG